MRVKFLLLTGISVAALTTSPDANAGIFPDSWSCSNNTCTGTYSNSSPAGIGIIFWNPSPLVAEFQQNNNEFVEFEPDAINCDVDHEAIDAAIGVKKSIDPDGVSNNTTNQAEYGAILADKGSGLVSGTIVKGQSYNQSAQPSLNLTPSRDSIGATNAQVVAIVHSHPYSGNSTTDNANKRPSTSEWQAADQIIAQGANPSRFTLYIIDRWGNLWAYAYTPPSQRTSNNPPARNVSTACQ